MDKHTRGECVSSTEREGRKGLCKVFQPKRMKCRDSTKYAPERMYKGKLQRLYKVYN
jgi:hypothetical protein